MLIKIYGPNHPKIVKLTQSLHQNQLYLSYFVNGATGGVIICLQTAIFLLAFFLAPKHGLLANRRRAREALRP